MKALLLVLGIEIGAAVSALAWWLRRGWPTRWSV